MADKKGSLREKLKELENPAFSVNFDDSDDEDLTLAKVAASEHVEDNLDSLKTFGNLRKKALSIEEDLDPKYSGNKVTRKNLKEWSEGEDSSVESYEDDNNFEISENENDISDDMDEIVEEGSEDDLLSNDDDNEDDNLSDTAITINPDMVPDDLKTAISKPSEEDMDIDHFTESKVNNEAQKGKATKIQLGLLDKLLESRIRFQKSMQLSNRFPQYDVMKDFRRRSAPQVKEGYETAKASLLELLKKLVSLQDTLLNSNSETNKILSGGGRSKKKIDSDEEIPSDTEDEDKEDSEKEEENIKTLNLPSKRKDTLTILEYEEEISKRHKALNSYQESTINKWYEKTRLASGKISSKNFNAFDKSTLQQIKQVLSDKDRLIKRTQLKRTSYSILGKTHDTDITADNQEEDSHLKDYDENIFDDGDFYHEMLKELIERKSNVNSEDPVAAGRQWLELQKLRTKIKRKIDTRASKGRKVRYNVHSKLVSFMAPQNAGSMSDQARNDLFMSLFGQAPPPPIR